MAKFLKLMIVTKAPNPNALGGVILSKIANRRGLSLFTEGGFRQFRCVSQRSSMPKAINRMDKKFPGSPDLFSATV